MRRDVLAKGEWDETWARRAVLTIISLSTCAVIGLFSRLYSPVQPAKIKLGFVAKLFCDSILAKCC